MIGGAAEREAQSGQLITDPASRRERETGLSEANRWETDLYESSCFCSSCLIKDPASHQHRRLQPQP